MDSSARLIALYSPRPQQGKSTVAAHLVSLGYKIVKFAEPLKVMTGQFLLAAGIPKGEVWSYVEGANKEKQIPGLPKGTTSRKVQRTLGTEWGRKCLSDSLWVDLALRKARDLLNEGYSVVIDDMRFPNEYDAILKNGGEVWRVVRSQEKFKSDGHSEALLEGKFFDLSVLNDKSILVLKQAISAVLALPPTIGQLRR